MSFILDALKKSETDRQTQSNAEFSGVPTRPQSQSVPRWLWLLAALLLINLVVLVGLLLRPAPAASSTMQTAPVNAGQTLPVATPSEEATSFQDQVAAARQNPPARQVAPPTDVARDKPENIVTPVLISQDASAVPASSLYPTYQEVMARGYLDLPAMHLDIHVYSPTASDRFAFVNMKKLREGSTMASGPEVAEITPDGVVFRYQSQLFVLPRE